jgi:hypothetical protein
MEQNINKTNFPAVGLFMLCHCIFHFAVAKFVAASDFDYLEVFQHVLREGDGIRIQLLSHVQRSGLLEHASLPVVRSSAAHTYHAETRIALDLLASARHPGDTPDAIIVACTQALESLKEWAKIVDGNPREWSHFFHWPCAVSPTFILALKERQPVATLIFVHWCAIMHQAPKIWFLDGWARRTAFAAMAELPTTPRDLLRWPMIVFDDGSTRKIRLSLTLRTDASVEKVVSP